MLSTNYRNTLKTKLNKLKVLDGIPTLNEQESTKKKKFVKTSAVIPVVAVNTSDINENFTLDLQLRVLQNIDGIYLTEETCKVEVLDALQND